MIDILLERYVQTRQKLFKLDGTDIDFRPLTELCELLKKQIQEKIEKGEKLDRCVNFWVNQGMSKERAELFQSSVDDAFLKSCYDVECKNKALTEQVKELKKYSYSTIKGLMEQIKQLQEERSKALSLASSASRESVLLQSERDELKSKIDKYLKVFQTTPYIRCCKCDHTMQELTKPFLVKENFGLSSINYRVCCIHDEAGNDKTFGKKTQYPKCKCDNIVYVDVKIPDELKEILGENQDE